MPGKFVRIPNSEAWINPDHVVAVARTADSEIHQKGELAGTGIKMVNFVIRSADGKVTNIQHHSREAISSFLYQIGVEWGGD